MVERSLNPMFGHFSFYKTINMLTFYFIFCVCIQLASCRRPDWLIHRVDYPVEVVPNETDGTITITNGLLSRKFRLSPGFVTIDLYSHEKNSSVLRALGPEVLSLHSVAKDWLYYFYKQLKFQYSVLKQRKLEFG